MRDWLTTLHDELAAKREPMVRVLVAATRGSAPRDAGACMLVSAGREWGTVGGGHLEHVATQTARGMLASTAETSRVDRFSLGASLGQCCGGIVELSFQRYDASDLASLAEMLEARGSAVPGDTELWLFGAGHVARALINILAPLPFRITWIDSREAMVPAGFPAHMRALHSPHPAEEVKDMAPGAWALVMTHSHDEDLALCEALLTHGRFGWAGVIGSGPKTVRFRQRLQQRGFAAEAIARLTMPIGIGAIRSKEPAAIAVAVAAQLLELREAAVNDRIDSSVSAHRS
ncbi:MAG TPA: xanthine dehydrogenase accessory protein XdhC [Usitatibacter sp.]|nr:xanthine dehydrogenase accessory protein XdhC [Usitatibacter sp.]